jgi:hypothetical protein
MQASVFKAGLWAGLIAGAVDLVLLMGILLGQGVPAGVTARMTAAVVLGTGVLPPPDTAGPGIIAAALGVHFGVSLVCGVIIALLIQRLERMPALAVGVGFGLAMWLVNYFAIAPVMFPWLTAMRSAPTTPFAHAIFGVAAVGAYLAIAARDRRAGADRRQVDQPVKPERRRPFERRGPA